MLSGYHAGPARPAERICHKAVCKSHPVPRNPVKVRRFHVPRVIAAHHLGRMVIGHYEEDIVRLPRLFLRTRKTSRPDKNRPGQRLAYSAYFHNILY